MDDVLVAKVTISASLQKIHLPKISDQAPLSKQTTNDAILLGL